MATTRCVQPGGWPRVRGLARFAGVLLLAFPLRLHAADQTVLGNQFVVKDGGKIVVVAKEVASDDAIVGNPIINGATLRIDATGRTSSSQVFVLPSGMGANGKSFWSGDAVKGFKYKDARGENGPVTRAAIRKSSWGVFELRVAIHGRHGEVDVVPPAPGAFGCALFTLTAGDAYSVAFTTGVVTNRGVTQFAVKKPTTEDICFSNFPVPCGACGTGGIGAWLPDIDGSYSCLGPPVTSGSCDSDAMCSSGDRCVDYYVFFGPHVNGCFATCGAYTCGTSPAPTCGGTCPTGQVCGQGTGTDACTCVTPDDTCGISQAPACGGTCPTGQVCGQNTGSNGCLCVDPDRTCYISQAPACGGTCPEMTGTVCLQAPGGTYCTCAPPDNTCRISEAPTCGGTCPTGQACGYSSSLNFCECVTPDNTCGISQAPTCGGTCALGVCHQVPGGVGCTCS